MGRWLQRQREFGQLAGVARRVVDTGDHRPFKTDATIFYAQIIATSSHQILQWVALVDRHQIVAQFVASSMQRHRQVDRQWASRQRANARHDANGRDRNVTRRNAHVAVDAFNCTPHGRFVGERFAHAHEHDVGHALFALLGVARSAHNLFDNFAHGELAVEASLTSCTKPTGHRTASLGAHTHGGTIGIVHEHCFNRVIAVGELPQKLDRVTFIAHTFAHEQQTGG